MVFVVAAALLPASALLIYSGRVAGGEAAAASVALARMQVHNAAQRQTALAASSRMLLATLAQLEEVKEARAKACSVLFQTIRLNSPVFNNIRLCTLAGETIASASSVPEPLTPEERKIIPTSLEKAIFTVVGGPIPKKGERPYINCLYPVQRNGAVTGYLVVSSLVSLDGGHGKEGGNAESLHLLMPEGHVLLSRLGTADGPLLSPELAESFFIRDSDYGIATTPDGDAFMFERFYPAKDSAPLVVAAGYSVESIRSAQLKRSLNNLGLLVGATLLALLITTGLIRSTLLRPVSNLVALAKRLKAGDLEARIAEMPQTKEPALLAEAFNRMAEALEAQDKALLDARDAANAAGRAKSEFLANMSHEIRTPMNAILGMAYLAERSNLNPQQAGYIRTIHAEAKLLLGTINDILDFSKIEAGKVYIEKITFNLREELLKIVQEYEEEAERKRTALRFEPAADLPEYLEGDALHLSQTVGNLFSNAVKYTERGSVTLACSHLPKEDGKILLRINVTDTGSGMSAEQTARNFPEAENRSAGIEAVSGLGLAITRRLVRLMGGTISAESEPGKGTRVTMLLPFIPASADRMEASSNNEFEGTAVLLASPPSPLRDAAAAKLALKGMTVETAARTEEGFLILSSSPKPYDLVLLDASLARHEGQDTAVHIREKLGLASPPAVLPLEETSLASENLRRALTKAPLSATGENALPEGLTLILADDNEVNRQIGEALLTASGAAVLIAEDGSQVLDILERVPPDQKIHAVLLDLQMPVMDGFETCRRIRADERFRHIPVIAASAQGKDEEWEQCAAAGMDDYLAKPIDVTLLRRILRKWAGHRSLWRPGTP